MSVRIRLQRHGAKKRPFYRVVAADQRAPRDGRFIELLGTYDPLREPPAIRLKADRISHWLSRGAQPSDTAKSLIAKVQNGEGVNLDEAGADSSATKSRLQERNSKINQLRKDTERAHAEAAAAAAAAEEEAKKAEEKKLATKAADKAERK